MDNTKIVSEIIRISNSIKSYVLEDEADSLIDSKNPEAWDIYMNISKRMGEKFPNGSYNGPKAKEATLYIIEELRKEYKINIVMMSGL